jgi:hypothetical protein
MKKILLTVITLFCLTTAIYGEDNDRQQSNKTTNMRSSSTRSTVNNNGSNVQDIRNGYVGNSRFMGGNMRRSGVTNGMGTGMTHSLVGNGSHGTKRNQSVKNDTTKKK